MIQCYFIVLTITLMTYPWQPFLSINRILRPHRVIGPPRIVGPHRVLDPGSSEGPWSHFSDMPNVL